jgi:hypothetical protein
LRRILVIPLSLCASLAPLALAFPSRWEFAKSGPADTDPAQGGFVRSACSFQGTGRCAGCCDAIVALDARRHTLLEIFSIVRREKIGRAFVGGPCDIAFRRAGNHKDSQNNQTRGSIHAASAARAMHHAFQLYVTHWRIAMPITAAAQRRKSPISYFTT